jgi:tRNA(Ile)-lysidine synthase
MHVEHGLRPEGESRGDAGFVLDFCKKHEIECKVETVPLGKIAAYARRRGVGIEAAARFFRHRALSGYAARLGEKTCILIAHTKDDLLETVLMRVLRGSGPSGLAAMPVKRGRILRPLISMTRADVVQYLKAKGIPWREDSTNEDEKYLRNRIRRRLIPLLNESFSSWKAALASMAETQSLVVDFIGGEAGRRVIWSPADRSLSTNAENFFAQPQIIREEAVFFAVDRLLTGRKSSVPVKRSVVRKFCAGIVPAADLGPVRLRREGETVALSLCGQNFCERGFSLLIKEQGLYNLKNITIEVRKGEGIGSQAEISPMAETLPSAACEDGVFYAALPLAFRRAFKDDFLVGGGRKITGRSMAKNLISALDRFGIAAFIESEWFAGRDFPQTADGRELYLVRISRNETRGA